MLIKIVKFLRGTKGASIPFIAVVLTLLLVLAGVVIDLGHLYVVRQELKNAAEAGALAGALALFNIKVSPHVLCAEAHAAALATVQLNGSDHQGLSALNEDVKVGFWEYVGGVWQFREASSCPDEINAVQVTTRRTSAVNGPVTLFFAKFLGMDTVDVTAKATAMRGWATSLPQGWAFPLAIGLTYVPENYGDRIPVTFSPDWGDAGGWHCFEEISADANQLKAYVNETIPTPPMELHDWITCLNGVAQSVIINAMIDQLKAHAAAGTSWIVYLPVIDATKMNQSREVLGFCAFEIQNVDKNTKAVSGDALGVYLVPGPNQSPTPTPNNNLRDIHAKLVQ